MSAKRKPLEQPFHRASTSKKSVDGRQKIFQLLLQEKNIPYCVEYKFLAERKFRFDYAFPDVKLAVEIEGGVFVSGRHTRPKGFVKDIEKYNLATLHGWRLLRFLPSEILKVATLNMIEQCYKQFRSE